ncbi:MAG: phosphatidylglycerophosphatase A [Candidatus Eisenbacteria bacterium]
MNRSDRKSLSWWIYSAAGAGLAPVAPGTAGSAAAAAFLLLPGRIPGIPAWTHPGWGALLVLLFFAGVWSCRAAEAAHGRDPGIVVVDEVVGMLVALFLVPNSLAAVAAGFFLFRLFDIVKPFPVRLAEKARGGWGILLDDVAAGIYANLALRLLLFIGGKVR